MALNSHTFRYEACVPASGRLEVDVPLPAGSQVTVIVVEKSAGELSDVVAASNSSLEFWNNELDDEDWNNA